MTILKKILTMKWVLLLDALLLAGCVWLGMHFRNQWHATAEANQVSKIVPPSVALKQAMEKQKTAEALQRNYLVIASQNLFSADRNDQIAKEAAEKPRPPKPILFGVMNLTDVQLALMSTPDSRVLRSLKVGETIGEYKLTKILMNKVELQYGNEIVEATTEEQPKFVAAPNAPAAQSGSGGRVVSVDSGSAVQPVASSTPAQQPVAPGKGPCKGKWVPSLFGPLCDESAK
jgi:hypothetical protein